MAEVIGVKFKETGKSYYFDPAGQTVCRGDRVIVETARGLECGLCVMENRDVPEVSIVKPLKRILRKADERDLKTIEQNKKREENAMAVCAEQIRRFKLDMHLVEAEYAFDGSKLTFYYTAPERVDFRELVKHLASTFHMRIELRQIGVRDQAKLLGGIGICGRPFCCKEFLHDFQPVSIKMAKEQGMSLNTGKISGTCGRLMCCLKYEQESYEYLLRHTPKVGALVETADGRGVVTDVNLLSGRLKVRLDSAPDAAPAAYDKRDVRLLRDGRIRVSKEDLAGEGDAAEDGE